MTMVLHFRGMLKGGHGRGGGKTKRDCPNWQQADDTESPPWGGPGKETLSCVVPQSGWEVPKLGCRGQGAQCSYVQIPFSL